jgi:hypothetical protein
MIRDDRNPLITGQRCDQAMMTGEICGGSVQRAFEESQ